MGCGCKSNDGNQIENNENVNISGDPRGLIINVLLFIFVIVLSPLILLLLLWIMFNSVVRKKPINETLNFIMKRVENIKEVKENEYNEEDEDGEEIDDVNYEYEIVGLDKSK